MPSSEPVKADAKNASAHSAQEQQPLRHSGMLVAAEVPDEAARDLALRVLREQGAVEIEENQGHIVAGDWADFDPLKPPQLIESSEPPQPLPVETRRA